MTSSPTLDARHVSRISAYLVEGDLDNTPATLASNAEKAFVGSFLRGAGFTFDDLGAEKGETESVAFMEKILVLRPRNAERIKPYIGGEEVNTSPTQAHRRYVIDFSGLQQEEAEERYPEVMEVIRRKVKPERDKLGTSAADRQHKLRWWLFAGSKPDLYTAISALPRVIVIPRVSPYLNAAILQTGTVFSDQLVVVAFPDFAPFVVLQSGTHYIWARSFSSSMKDDLRYAASDCFETFPFPEDFETLQYLEAPGQAYYEHRAALMVDRGQGMTKIYNRLHDPDERDEGIVRLRELHAEMDRAVLRAYAWDDLAERAEPIFLDETNEDEHTYQGRLFWPSAFRDEVLARLLALNAERHSEEVRRGIAPGLSGAVLKEGDEEETEPEREAAN